MSQEIIVLDPDRAEGRGQSLRLELAEWRELKRLARNVGIDLDDIGFGHDAVYHVLRTLSRVRAVHPLLQKLKDFLAGPGRAGYSVRREKTALVPAAATPSRPRRGQEVIDIERFRVQPRPVQPQPKADEVGFELYVEDALGAGAAVRLSRGEWATISGSVRRISGYVPDEAMGWREAEVFAQYLARCAEKFDAALAAKARAVLALCGRGKTVHIAARKINR